MGSDRLVVLNKDDDTMSIIDIETGAQREHIETAFNPHEVIVGPDGETAYVANNKSNDVSVIDVSARREIERLPAGTHPDGIAYLPD